MLRDVPWDHPDAVRLREEQRLEIAEAYGRDDSEPAGSEARSADVFLVCYRDGEAVACGAVRVIAPGVGEIKRMYAAPSARGAVGAAAEVLRGLEDWARDRGLASLRLETGDLLLAAQRFYTREGYRPIELYGPYVGSDLSRCFEKELGTDR